MLTVSACHAVGLGSNPRGGVCVLIHSYDCLCSVLVMCKCIFMSSKAEKNKRKKKEDMHDQIKCRRNSFFSKKSAKSTTYILTAYLAVISRTDLT